MQLQDAYICTPTFCSPAKTACSARSTAFLAAITQISPPSRGHNGVAHRKRRAPPLIRGTRTIQRRPANQSLYRVQSCGAFADWCLACARECQFCDDGGEKESTSSELHLRRFSPFVASMAVGKRVCSIGLFFFSAALPEPGFLPVLGYCFTCWRRCDVVSPLPPIFLLAFFLLAFFFVGCALVGLLCVSNFGFAWQTQY